MSQVQDIPVPSAPAEADPVEEQDGMAPPTLARLNISPTEPSQRQAQESKKAELEARSAFPMEASLDRFGFHQNDRRFQLHNAKPVSPAEQQKNVWIENNRTRKWVEMVGAQLEHWEVAVIKNHKTLKKRIRKGIPDALRGRVWCELLGSYKLMKDNPGVYAKLNAQMDCPCEDAILRDIGRTFPNHYMFAQTDSMGQKSLLNVLRAYSIHDPDVGYCQGMGFIAALFLSYMPEEQCFWLLVSCLTNKTHALAGLYRPGMSKVTQVMETFEGLMKIHVPQIYQHFEREGLHPTMYASQWFITLYSYSFSFEMVTRVWDCFLHEGWKIIYRVALALLKINKKKIMAMKFEHLMEFFQNLPLQCDTQRVLTMAYSIPLRTNTILQLEQQVVANLR